MAKRLKGKAEQVLLKKVGQKLEEEKIAESKRRMAKFRKGFDPRRAGKVGRVRRSGGRKAVKRRSVGTRRVLQAAGIAPGPASQAGPGRPKGSFKYRIGGKPVSVFEWRKHQALRKAQLSQFQSQQNQRLKSKGFSDEQLQAMRQHRAIQNVQKGKPVMERNLADEELAFRKHLAANTVSPRTQQIMVALRRTQNKAKSDNVEHERRVHERNMVGRQMNLMEAHTNMNPIKIDFTGVSEDNILSSPSLFKENPENNILRSNRRTILDMQENDLRFFG